MSNLVSHPEMQRHLAQEDKLKLWVAFAYDYEENFECARAAAGCLAMATSGGPHCEDICKTLVKLPRFKDMTMGVLECGNLELMHRILVMCTNLVHWGETLKEAVERAGVLAFCRLYLFVGCIWSGLVGEEGMRRSWSLGRRIYR